MDAARIPTFFVDARKFYMDYDQRLNTARTDGKRRWGTEWIESDKAQEKWQKVMAYSDEVSRLNHQVDRLDAVRTHAWEMWQDILHGMDLNGTRARNAAKE